VRLLHAHRAPEDIVEDSHRVSPSLPGHYNARHGVAGAGNSRGKSMRNLIRAAAAAFFVFGCLAASAQQATGKLLLDVKPFTSEVKLKAKVKDTLEHGALDWGVKDGRIVFTSIAKQYINFELNNFTRFGEQKEVELPAGDYKVSCAGLVPHTAFSPQAMLSKGGFFNIDVMTVHIEPGKTTTLTIAPAIRKQKTLLLNFFQAEFVATTTLDGVVSPEVSLNMESPSSIKWDAYTGDLKFATK